MHKKYNFWCKRRLGDLILLQIKISKMEAPFEYALQCESGLVSIRITLKGRVTWAFPRVNILHWTEPGLNYMEMW